MAVDTRVIERTITIQAPPETVFRLLTDPTEYVRWKGRLAQLEALLRLRPAVAVGQRLAEARVAV